MLLNYFNGNSILIHADTTGLKKDLFMTAKNINNERIYALVANYGQDNCSIPLENVDVHGMMLSSQTSIDLRSMPTTSCKTSTNHALFCA